MARVTVEDCVLKIPNRFELVMLAAHRARAIAAGAPLTIDRDRDKNPVVALREIADETIKLDLLNQSLVGGLQKHIEADQPEEDNMAELLSNSEWAGIIAEDARKAETVSIIEAGEEQI